MKDNCMSYYRHLNEYQAIIDELKKHTYTNGWSYDTQTDIAEQTGIAQPKVGDILTRMSKEGGILEKRKIAGKLYEYRILYSNLDEEGPMAEIPIVYVLMGLLDLDSAKNKAKRCGVSSWTYQRARAYLAEDEFNMERHSQYREQFQKMIDATLEKYGHRIIETLCDNMDILKPEAKSLLSNAIKLKIEEEE